MREKKILDNLGLIYKVMKDMNCQYKDQDDFDDIFGAGLIGLINGIDTLDDSKSKSKYLYMCISNNIKILFKYRTSKKNFNGMKEISINQPLRNEKYLEDIIPNNVDIEKETINKELIEKIIKIINKFKKEKNIEIICKYYGLGYPKKTLRELAEEYNVSFQSIQQRIKRDIKKIKREIEKG